MTFNHFAETDNNNSDGKNYRLILKSAQSCMHYEKRLTNVLFTLNRTTHSSKTLLRLVRFNVNKTLFHDLILLFLQLDNLELHVRSHSTERPFVCIHCEKCYKDAPSLYSHMQSHHTAKRSHLCSECGASFMKSDHLKRHINSTHRKIKTIKCNYCDMMFSDK